MNEVIVINVEEHGHGERLDSFISDEIERLSRQYIQTLIKEGHVLVNGNNGRASLRLKEHDSIRVEVPEMQEILVEACDIPLDVVYEDSELLVINKPKGLVVHPAPGNWDQTLVNALLFHVKDLSGINGKLRPGIVHRLDKDTSGLIVVAKNDASHRGLAEQIKDHSFNREYIALVHGVIQENLGMIDAPIGRSKKDRKKMAVEPNGKQALSQYSVVKRYRNYSLVNIKLLTGRTHQIRVHFAYIKHPVLGDSTYGSGRNPFGLESQFLHARLLGFIHPLTGSYMEFSCDMPSELQAIINKLDLSD